MDVYRRRQSSTLDLRTRHTLVVARMGTLRALIISLLLRVPIRQPGFR